MALPAQVKPGDVISSDLINGILDALAQLQGAGTSGTQTVPNLFGVLLREASSILLQAGGQFTLGFTLDVAGAQVDPLATANANLVVLNQNPAAQTRVASGTPINLVVSQSSVVGPSPTGEPPTITGTETGGGVASTRFAVSTSLVLVGTNFSATASQNTVTFNGVPATSVTSHPSDPTRRLVVGVPTGIEGAPEETGAPDLENVTVRVLTPNGTPATTSITVVAPVAAQPTVTAVSPTLQFVGANITITGTNFTSAALVRIRGTTAAVVSISSTEIVATIPDLGIATGVTVPVSVVVSMSGFSDVTYTGSFSVIT